MICASLSLSSVARVVRNRCEYALSISKDDGTQAITGSAKVWLDRPMVEHGLAREDKAITYCDGVFHIVSSHLHVRVVQGSIANST